jgi:hypothetical protein
MPAMKNFGEPCAGEPHARIEVAAGANQRQSATPRSAGASRRPDHSQFLAGLLKAHRGRSVALVQRRCDFAGHLLRSGFSTQAARDGYLPARRHH